MESYHVQVHNVLEAEDFTDPFPFQMKKMKGGVTEEITVIISCPYFIFDECELM